MRGIELKTFTTWIHDHIPYTSTTAYNLIVNFTYLNIVSAGLAKRSLIQFWSLNVQWQIVHVFSGRCKGYILWSNIIRVSLLTVCCSTTSISTVNPMLICAKFFSSKFEMICPMLSYSKRQGFFKTKFVSVFWSHK